MGFTNWFQLSAPNLLGVFAFSYYSFLIFPSIFSESLVVSSLNGRLSSPAISPFTLSLHASFFLVIFFGLLFRFFFTTFLKGSKSHSAPEKPTKGLSIDWMLYGFATGIGILLWFLLTVRSELPLLLELQGENSLAVLQARQSALTGRAGSLLAYFFEFSRNFLFSVLAASALVLFQRSRTFISVIFAISMSSLALLASLLTLEKSPTIRLIIVCFLALHWSSNFSRRFISFGAVTTSLVYLGLVRMSIGSGGTDNELGRLISAAWDRLAVGPVATASNYFNWVEENSVPALLGRTLSTFNRFMTEGPVDSSRLVYDYADPGALVHGSANGAFFSQFWVDFRWLGVIVGCALVGVLIEAIQTLIGRVGQPHIRLALAGLFAFQVIILTMTAASESIVNVGFGALDLLVLLCVVDYRWRRLEYAELSKQR